MHDENIFKCQQANNERRKHFVLLSKEFSEADVERNVLRQKRRCLFLNKIIIIENGHEQLSKEYLKEINQER